MKVYIDVGHGRTGEDSGCSRVSGPTKYYENERNRRIALKVAEVLRAAGYKVTLSRAEGTPIVPVGNRDYNENIGGLYQKYNQADSNIINSANRIKSGSYDFAISIHCNDSDNSNAHGLWLCEKFLTKEANAIAANFIKNYNARSDTGNFVLNGVSSDYTKYGILRLHSTPAILFECGFFSNDSDLHEILCNYSAIGEELGRAIVNYFGVEEKKIDTAKVNNYLSEIKSIVASIEKNYLAEIKSIVESIEKEVN